MNLTTAEDYAMRPYDGQTFTFKDNPWIELPAHELADLIRQIQADALRFAVEFSSKHQVGPFNAFSDLEQIANQLHPLPDIDNDTPEIVCNIDPNDPNP